MNNLSIYDELDQAIESIIAIPMRRLFCRIRRYRN